MAPVFPSFEGAATPDTPDAPGGRAAGADDSSSKRQEVLAAVLTLLAAVALTFPDLLSGHVFYERDILFYWYPRLDALARVVAQGAWPLWDPYTSYGVPMLADPSYGLLYPPIWPSLVLPPGPAYSLYVVFHLTLGGLGVAVLARSCGLRRLAALGGGVAFAISGPVVSLAPLVHHLAGLAWLPWLAWALQRRVAVLTAVLVLVLLAGSPEMVVCAALIACVRAAVACWRRDWPMIRRLATAGLLTVGLTAVQWVSALEVVAQSERGALPVRSRLEWSLHPANLVEVLVPNLLSDAGLTDRARAALFDGHDGFLWSLYLGGGASLLAAVGALLGRRPAALGAVCAALLFGGLALGKHTPLLSLLTLAPPFSLLRYPAKFFPVAALFWSGLVALGLDAWACQWRAREKRIALRLAGLTGALAAAAGATGVALHLAPGLAAGWLSEPTYAALAAQRFALAGAGLGVAAALLVWRSLTPAANHLTTGLLVAVSACELLFWSQRVNDLAPPELMKLRPSLLAELRAEPDSGRLYVPQPIAGWVPEHLVHGMPGWPWQRNWALAGLEMLHPSSAALWGLKGALDGDINGLGPPAVARLSPLLWNHLQDPLGVNLLVAGGVSHVILVDRPVPPTLVEVTRADSLFDQPLRLLRVPGAAPRAYLVGRAHELPDDSALQLLSSLAFDPRNEAVVAPGGGELRDGAGGEVRILADRADQIQLSVDASGPALLVLTEGYHAGWRVRIDGRPVPLRRANLLLLAVSVPEGRHEVAFRYRPAGPLWGGAVSLATVISIIGWGRRRRALRP